MLNQTTLTCKERSNTRSKDCTEINPTRGYISQRTQIQDLVSNTTSLSETQTPPVNFRELQRCSLEARQGLGWEQMDLRVVMQLSSFFDSFKDSPKDTHRAQPPCPQLLLWLCPTTVGGGSLAVHTFRVTQH